MEARIKVMYRSFIKTMLIAFAVGLVLDAGIVVGLLSMNILQYAQFVLGASLVLLLYTVFSSYVYFLQVGKGAVVLARYYMVHTFVRFILGGLLLFGCSQLAESNMRMILFSFLGIFLLTLIAESSMFVHIEKKLNESQSNS